MVTLTTLRACVRQRADMVNSGFVEDDELDGYINNSYKRLYNLLVSAFEDYYVDDPVAFTISSGNTFILPDNFYKLRGVDLIDQPGSAIPLGKWNFNERGGHNSDLVRNLYGLSHVSYRLMGNKIRILPEDSAHGNYQYWMVPKAPTLVVGVAGSLQKGDLTFTAVNVYVNGNLISIEFIGGGTAGSEIVSVFSNEIQVTIENTISTADQILAALNASPAAMALISVAVSGSGSTGQAIFSTTNLLGSVIQVDMDDVNGYDEFVICDAAIKCLNKEETDIRALMKITDQIQLELEGIAANRDISLPEQISDVTSDFGFSRLGRGY